MTQRVLPAAQSIAAALISWDPVGLDVAPRDSRYGPHNIQGHIRRLYEHSAGGAAFAAINITMAAIGYQDSSVIEKQETAGPGKEESLANQSLQSGVNSLVGYHVDAFSPRQAVVTIVLTVGNQLAALTQSMVWVDGDWMIDGSVKGASVPQKVLSALPSTYTKLTQP